MSGRSIVSDGRQRFVTAIKPSIQKQVESEYAEAWKSSGLIRRWFLWRRIKKEVAQRIAAKVADKATY